jgi:hypothetical protein
MPGKQININAWRVQAPLLKTTSEGALKVLAKFSCLVTKHCERPPGDDVEEAKKRLVEIAKSVKTEFHKFLVDAPGATEAERETEAAVRTFDACERRWRKLPVAFAAPSAPPVADHGRGDNQLVMYAPGRGEQRAESSAMYAPRDEGDLDVSGTIRPPDGRLVLVMRLCEQNELAQAEKFAVENNLLRGSLTAAIEQRKWACLDGVRWHVEVVVAVSPLEHVAKPAFRIRAQSLESQTAEAEVADAVFAAVLTLATTNALLAMGHFVRERNFEAQVRVMIVPRMKRYEYPVHDDGGEVVLTALGGLDAWSPPLPIVEQTSDETASWDELFELVLLQTAVEASGAVEPAAAERAGLPVAIMIDDPSSSYASFIDNALQDFGQKLKGILANEASSAELVALDSTRSLARAFLPSGIVLDLVVRVPDRSVVMTNPQMIGTYAILLRDEALKLFKKRLGRAVSETDVTVLFHRAGSVLLLLETSPLVARLLVGLVEAGHEPLVDALHIKSAALVEEGASGARPTLRLRGGPPSRAARKRHEAELAATWEAWVEAERREAGAEAPAATCAPGAAALAPTRAAALDTAAGAAGGADGSEGGGLRAGDYSMSMADGRAAGGEAASGAAGDAALDGGAPADGSPGGAGLAGVGAGGGAAGGGAAGSRSEAGGDAPGGSGGGGGGGGSAPGGAGAQGSGGGGGGGGGDTDTDATAGRAAAPASARPSVAEAERALRESKRLAGDDDDQIDDAIDAIVANPRKYAAKEDARGGALAAALLAAQPAAVAAPPTTPRAPTQAGGAPHEHATPSGSQLGADELTKRLSQAPAVDNLRDVYDPDQRFGKAVVCSRLRAAADLVEAEALREFGADGGAEPARLSRFVLRMRELANDLSGRRGVTRTLLLAVKERVDSMFPARAPARRHSEDEIEDLDSEPDDFDAAARAGREREAEAEAEADAEAPPGVAPHAEAVVYERPQRPPLPGSPEPVARAYEIIMGIPQLRQALRFELVPFLSRTYASIAERFAQLDAATAHAGVDEYGEGVWRRMLGGGKCQSRKTPLKVCMVVLCRLMGVATVVATTGVTGRNDVFRKFLELLDGVDVPHPADMPVSASGVAYAYEVAVAGVAMAELPRLVESRAARASSPKSWVLNIPDLRKDRHTAWVNDTLLQGGCLVVNNSAPALCKARQLIISAQNQGLRAQRLKPARMLQFVLIIGAADARRPRPTRAPPLPRPDARPRVRRRRRRRRRAPTDEADDFYRTACFREGQESEALKLEASMEDLRVLGPIIQFEVTATLLAIYLIYREIGTACTIHPEDVVYTDASAEYIGTDSFQPLVDEDDAPLFLEPGVLKPANDYTDSKVLALWRDAARHPRALCLDATSPAVTAKGNIFTKAKWLLAEVPRAVAMVVSGSAICWYTATPRAGRASDAHWQANNFKGKARIFATILEEVDRLYRDYPVYVFGYSQLVRGISYRSRWRVPTHMVLLYGKSTSMCRLVQAAGRANGEQAGALRQNGFEKVTLLTLANDYDAICNYPAFLEKIKRSMDQQGHSLDSALGSSSGAYLAGRTIGPKRAALDTGGLCDAPPTPGQNPGADSTDAQLREPARSVQRAVLEVLLDRMAWDAHSAMSASDVHAELSANAAHYDAFCGARSTDARASALDRRGVADVLEALAALLSHREPVLIKEREGRCNIFFVDADVLALVRPAAAGGGGGGTGAREAEGDVELQAGPPSGPPSPAPSLRGPHAYAMEQARTQMDKDFRLDSQQPAADYGGGGPPGAAARGGEAAGSRAPRDLGAAFATASPPLPSSSLPSAREVIDLTADDPPSAPAVDGGSPAEGESNRKRPRTGL